MRPRKNAPNYFLGRIDNMMVETDGFIMETWQDFGPDETIKPGLDIGLVKRVIQEANSAMFYPSTMMLARKVLGAAANIFRAQIPNFQERKHKTTASDWDTVFVKFRPNNGVLTLSCDRLEDAVIRFKDIDTSENLDGKITLKTLKQMVGSPTKKGLVEVQIGSPKQFSSDILKKLPQVRYLRIGKRFCLAQSALGEH